MAFELICIEVKQTIMKTSARCESKKSYKNKNIPRLQQNLSHWVYRTKFAFYIFTKIIVHNIQKSFKIQYSKINHFAYNPIFAGTDSQTDPRIFSLLSLCRSSLLSLALAPLWEYLCNRSVCATASGLKEINQGLHAATIMCHALSLPTGR